MLEGQRRAKGNLRLARAPKGSQWDGDRPGPMDLDTVEFLVVSGFFRVSQSLPCCSIRSLGRLLGQQGRAGARRAGRGLVTCVPRLPGARGLCRADLAVSAGTCRSRGRSCPWRTTAGRWR